MQQDSDYSANGDPREKFFNFAENIADFGNMIHQQCNIFAGVDGAHSHRSCVKIRVICSILKARNIRMHYRGEDFFICFFDRHNLFLPSVAEPLLVNNPNHELRTFTVCLCFGDGAVIK
jgi:hypothetical protein